MYWEIIDDSGGSNIVVKGNPVRYINRRWCGQYPCSRHCGGGWRKSTKPAVNNDVQSSQVRHINGSLCGRQEGTWRWEGGLSTYPVVRKTVQSNQVRHIYRRLCRGEPGTRCWRGDKRSYQAVKTMFKAVKSTYRSKIMWPTSREKTLKRRLEKLLGGRSDNQSSHVDI